MNSKCNHEVQLKYLRPAKNTKSSTTPTAATPESRELKTKHNIRDFIPNPMTTDVAVPKERLEPGKLAQ